MSENKEDIVIDLFDFGDSRYSTAYAKAQSRKYKHFDLPSPKYFSGFFGYKFLWYLKKPFTKWRAYKYGLIDKEGYELRKAVGRDEKEYYNYWVKLIIRMKQLMAKQIDKARLSLIFDRLFLVRESKEDVLEKMIFFFDEMDKINNSELHKLIESTMSGAMATDGGGFNPDLEKEEKKLEKKRKKKRKKLKSFKETLEEEE